MNTCRSVAKVTVLAVRTAVIAVLMFVLVVMLVLRVAVGVMVLFIELLEHVAHNVERKRPYS